MKKIKGTAIGILAIIGGIAYRMGGSGNFPRYIRELVQGLCSCGVLALMGIYSWGLFGSFGMAWAESTYFKIKGEVTNISWGLVGLVFGLIPLPTLIFAKNHHWLGFGIRVPVCVGLTILWNQILSDKVSKFFINVLKVHWTKDITDEFGRGFINVATMPLLLIG